jgi:hypothetical protein
MHTCTHAYTCTESGLTNRTRFPRIMKILFSLEDAASTANTTSAVSKAQLINESCKTTSRWAPNPNHPSTPPAYCPASGNQLPVGYFHSYHLHLHTLTPYPHVLYMYSCNSNDNELPYDHPATFLFSLPLIADQTRPPLTQAPTPTPKSPSTKHPAPRTKHPTPKALY